MKYQREHVDTLTKSAAKALLVELGLDGLPKRSDVVELATESTGRYIMMLARDKNYDILYEHWRL